MINSKKILNHKKKTIKFKNNKKYNIIKIKKNLKISKKKKFNYEIKKGGMNSSKSKWSSLRNLISGETEKQVTRTRQSTLNIDFLLQKVKNTFQIYNVDRMYHLLGLSKKSPLDQFVFSKIGKGIVLKNKFNLIPWIVFSDTYDKWSAITNLYTLWIIGKPDSERELSSYIPFPKKMIENFDCNEFRISTPREKETNPFIIPTYFLEKYYYEVFDRVSLKKWVCFHWAVIPLEIEESVFTKSLYVHTDPFWQYNSNILYIIEVPSNFPFSIACGSLYDTGKIIGDSFHTCLMLSPCKMICKDVYLENDHRIHLMKIDQNYQNDNGDLWSKPQNCLYNKYLIEDITRYALQYKQFPTPTYKQVNLLTIIKEDWKQDWKQDIDKWDMYRWHCILPRHQIINIGDNIELIDTIVNKNLSKIVIKPGISWEYEEVTFSNISNDNYLFLLFDIDLTKDSQAKNGINEIFLEKKNYLCVAKIQSNICIMIDSEYDWVTFINFEIFIKIYCKIVDYGLTSQLIKIENEKEAKEFFDDFISNYNLEEFRASLERAKKMYLELSTQKTITEIPKDKMIS